MSKAWLRRHRRDYYYRKAKEERYRSRAAYKLLESVEKYGFIRPGYVVVDLGAAPGGWTQASHKIVGSSGFVLGVDLKPLNTMEFSNVRLICGDVADPELTTIILRLLPRPPDAVISDVSPNISGIWELDHARQIELASQSLRIATSTLTQKGSFFVKVFQGDLLNDFVNKVKRHFNFVKRTKPKASRAKSSELYVLGDKLKEE